MNGAVRNRTAELERARGLQPRSDPTLKQRRNLTCNSIQVRPTRIELAFSRWQRDVLPLDHGRFLFFCKLRGSTDGVIPLHDRLSRH